MTTTGSVKILGAIVVEVVSVEVEAFVRGVEMRRGRPRSRTGMAGINFFLSVFILFSNSLTNSGAFFSSARLRQKFFSDSKPSHFTKYSAPFLFIIRFVMIFFTSYDLASSVFPSTCMEDGGRAVLLYGSDVEDGAGSKCAIENTGCTLQNAGMANRYTKAPIFSVILGMLGTSNTICKNRYERRDLVPRHLCMSSRTPIWGTRSWPPRLTLPRLKLVIRGGRTGRGNSHICYV